MRITGNIRKALQEACESVGSPAELARRVGINKANISRYLSGATEKIADDNWEKLRSVITPYLDDPVGDLAPILPPVPDTIQNTLELREAIKDAMMAKGITSADALRHLIGYDSTKTLERLLAGKLNWFPDMLSAVLDTLEITHDDAPITPAERMMLAPEGFYNDGGILIRPIPVVDWANAADYISGLVAGNGTVMKNWNPNTTELIPAPVGMRRGVVALRVHGESMEPKIQDGDALYCLKTDCLSEIPNGKVIVAKFNDNFRVCPECVVCKRLRRFGNTTCLMSDNPAGRNFENIEPRDISWCGVVVGKYCDDF